jgi:hypothetical protein
MAEVSGEIADVRRDVAVAMSAARGDKNAQVAVVLALAELTADAIHAFAGQDYTNMETALDLVAGEFTKRAMKLHFHARMNAERQAS